MGTPRSSNAPVEIVPTGWDLEFARQYGYSFGVARGRHLWIAGQVSVDERGEPYGVGEIETQTRRVFERVRAVVEAAGGTMADIVSTTTYITDRSYRPITNELRRVYFPGPPYPANSLIIVADLAMPDYLVEIDAVGVLHEE
jgi:2-iminobutanoate/2-iminopropanoate deaminase